MTHSITYGDSSICYQLKRSERRNSLSITVDGGNVSVSAPQSLCSFAVEKHVRDKGSWIIAKLDENKNISPVYPRKFESGESLLYLGRQHQLKVHRDCSERSFKLKQGRFILQLQPSDNPQEVGQKLVMQWYKQRLDAILPSILERFRVQLNLPQISYQVRTLGSRWGSCGKQGNLYFHWQLAKLPLTEIEFVCAHETVHIIEPNHTKEFQKLLGKILPEQVGRVTAKSL